MLTLHTGRICCDQRVLSTSTSRAGRASRAPPASAPKLPIDARSAKAERLIGTAQLKTDSSRAGRADRRGRGRVDSFEPTSCVECGGSETFAVDQLSSLGAIAACASAMMLRAIHRPFLLRPAHAKCPVPKSRRAPCSLRRLGPREGGRLDQYRGALSKRTPAFKRVPDGASPAVR